MLSNVYPVSFLIPPFLDEKNASLVSTLKSKMNEYFNRAASIKKFLKEREEPQKVSASDGDKPSSKGQGYFLCVSFITPTPTI